MKHPGVPVTVRPAAAEDIRAVLRIQEVSPGASQWGAEAYLISDCRVAVCNGEVAGFLATRSISETEHEVLNLAVHPRRRRAGVATALLEDALARLRGEVFLEVRESNEAARRLYRKLGFWEAGIRRNYYSDPAEAAIVMKRQSW